MIHNEGGFFGSYSKPDTLDTSRYTDVDLFFFSLFWKTSACARKKNKSSIFFFPHPRLHARTSVERLSPRYTRNEGSSRLAPLATRVVICVSRAFCSTDQEKKETARSLPPPLPLCAGSQLIPHSLFFIMGARHTLKRK